MKLLHVTTIKKDFPLFIHHPTLSYLDSTATSLKPLSVIEKEREYYAEYSANVFRGIYKISERATEEYEASRKVVARFIRAADQNEVVFTRNTSESLNLVAYALGRKIVERGDELVTSIMEHHSNFVPWQVLAQETGADFKIMHVTPEGYLDVFDRGKVNLEGVVTRKTKILAITYVSNVTGTINPVKEIIRQAKRINPRIIAVVDAAQAVPHMDVDVQELGCDFLAFSSHKMLGPTGVGVLWGKMEHLSDMYPFLYGGEMISEVHVEKTLFKEPPHKFEAGTPHIAGVSALKEAVAYLEKLGMKAVREHEKQLIAYALKRCHEEFGDFMRILGPVSPEEKGGILAFTFGSIHPHDTAYILDQENVAVRAGNHCAMPLHEFLKIGATTRASFYVYNDTSDVETLVAALKKVQRTLG